MSVDPYTILGVSRDASYDEVKEAYQREVLKWHPDKCREETSTKRFIEIRGAWDVLSEKSKKSHYDTINSQRSEIVGRNEFNFVDGVYSKNCRCGDKYEVNFIIFYMINIYLNSFYLRSSLKI